MGENVVFDEFPSWFLITESVSIAILLGIVLISFFVYFIEIQIFWTFRSTTFKGPFYRLMFVGILVDMISAINLFTGQIVPARGWLSSFYFKNESIVGAIFYTITYGGRCVQGATATILSFMRVCAICFPVLYRQLNQPKYTYTMQSLQLIGAVAAPILLLPKDYRYVPENGGYYSAFVDNSFRKPFYNFVAVLEVFFVLCIVVNNLVTYTMFHAKFNKKKVARRGSLSGAQYLASKETQKRESSLDRMTLIVCCVELIYFSFVVYALQINQNMDKKMFYFLYNILCVVYSTFSAWMLLIVSKPITKEFKTKFLKNSSSRLVRSVSISVQGGSREVVNK